MDKLVTLPEVRALTALFSKCTMSPAEQLWAQMFANRLFAYANQKPPVPKKDEEVVEEGTPEPEIDLDIKQPGPGLPAGAVVEEPNDANRDGVPEKEA